MKPHRILLIVASCGLALACGSSGSNGSGNGSGGSGNGGGSSGGGDQGNSGVEADAGDDTAPGTTDAGGGAAETGAPSATNDSGAALTGHEAKIVLEVPATYTGTLSRIDLVYNATASFFGPPTGTLYEGTPSGVTAGQPFTLIGDATGVSGDYYVVAILYMKGGGTYVPAPGIDYVGETPAPVAFSGGTIDLGTLPVIVAPSDGGL